MKTFGIRESAAGLMLGVGALGFVVGPLVAGMLSDRTSPKVIFLIGLGVEAVLLTCFSFAPTFPLAIAAYFLFSIGAGFIETVVNIVPTQVEPDRPGSLMNVVHMFFSIGAFISPILAGLILRDTGSWRPVYWVVAVPTAILFLLIWRSPFPPTPAAAAAIKPAGRVGVCCGSGRFCSEPGAAAVRRRGVRRFQLDRALCAEGVSVPRIGGDLRLSAWWFRLRSAGS